MPLPPEAAHESRENSTMDQRLLRWGKHALLQVNQQPWHLERATETSCLIECRGLALTHL